MEVQPGDGAGGARGTSVDGCVTAEHLEVEVTPDFNFCSTAESQPSWRNYRFRFSNSCSYGVEIIWAWNPASNDTPGWRSYSGFFPREEILIPPFLVAATQASQGLEFASVEEGVVSIAVATIHLGASSKGGGGFGLLRERIELHAREGHMNKPYRDSALGVGLDVVVTLSAPIVEQIEEANDLPGSCCVPPLPPACGAGPRAGRGRPRW